MASESLEYTITSRETMSRSDISSDLASHNKLFHAAALELDRSALYPLADLIMGYAFQVTHEMGVGKVMARFNGRGTDVSPRGRAPRFSLVPASGDGRIAAVTITVLLINERQQVVLAFDDEHHRIDSTVDLRFNQLWESLLLGDHQGFDEKFRAILAQRCATRLSDKEWVTPQMQHDAEELCDLYSELARSGIARMRHSLFGEY